MPERRKKLIETALPLKKINEHSAREKSIRHGHPSTLHLWWARRPLAACRAVLFAQLVDDPSSDPLYKMPDGSVDEERAKLKREELFKLIEDLVKWENSTNLEIINKARAEIALCVASRKIELGELKKETIIFGPEEGQTHPKGALPNDGRFTAWQINCRLAPPKAVNHFLSEYAPPVLDPFAGGGSIPLEAQRLGLRAHASDLNPVAVLINKALIEIPPKFAGMPPVNPEWQQKSDAEKKLTSWQGASGLAEDVRYYGQWMRNEAEKRIGYLYPKVKITQEMAGDRPDLKPYVGQELTVIAWLWARTVSSPNPALDGVHVPLVRSFWLSKKKGKEAWVEPIVDHKTNSYQFEVHTQKSNPGGEPPEGIMSRSGGHCLISKVPMPYPHIRAEAKAGRMSQRLMAIVLEGKRERIYLSPEISHIKVAESACPSWKPGGTMPLKHRNFQPPVYGMFEFGDLFTPRQLTALTTFSNLVLEARDQAMLNATKAEIFLDDNRQLAEGGKGTQAYSEAVATYLAFAIDKSSNYWSSLCGWHSGRDIIMSTFGRQALPMVWDFAEANPLSDSTGNYLSGIRSAYESLMNAPACNECFVQQSNATNTASYSGQIVSTDPPYYDNICYADLSDFFYVWLRRSLKGVYPELLSTMLTPKSEEMIASSHRHDGSNVEAATFFEKGLGNAIGQWRVNGHKDYPTTIFYAFKQVETSTEGTASTGWETFLTGIVEHGFVITATWPIRTELTGNLKKKMAALASSVVLSCVPRPQNAPMATRREFLNALKQELPDALRLLQTGSIAPVDLAQAAIGPGMAVFSRYSKVIEADGSPMGVRTALILINQMLDEVLAEQEGEFDADTRWAVSWFEQYGVQEGPYGVAETLSKAKNTSVQGLTESGIVKSRSGAVQLLGRNQLPSDWDPSKDKRLTAWESTQYLIQALDQKGETGAAGLLRQLGGDFGDRARDLAYRLYSICERKGWAAEALAYNSIVLAWPEITRLAQAEAPSDDARYKDADIFQQE
jgi:putative DNA methylase